MKQSKVGTLFIVSVLALAGVGISYAGLSDLIVVNGIVDTGTVELEVFDFSGTWVFKIYGFTPTAPPPGTPFLYDLDDEILVYKGIVSDPIQYPGEQAVIDWAASYGGVAELVSWSQGRPTVATDPINPNTGEPYDAVIEFVNIFPSLQFHADIDFHYIGTIPAKIVEVVETWDSTIITLPNGQVGPWLAYLEDNGGFSHTLGSSPLPVQLHYCNHLFYNVNITVPQDNAFQGVTGTGYLSITVQQWNDECEEQLPGKTIALPDYPITATYYYPGDDSYWDVVLDDIDSTIYNVVDGVEYDGWCVDEFHYIVPGTDYIVTLWSSLDFQVPGFPWPGNNHGPTGFEDYDWPCVNYIINHKGTANANQIQAAIWYFVDGGTLPSDPVALALVNDALANVVSWYADFPTSDPGNNMVAVILDPGADVQHVFIEVDP